MQAIFLSKFALKQFSFALLIILSLNVFSSENEPISFGKVVVGDDRIALKVSDFNIRLKLNEDIKSKVILKKDSIQWIRIDEVLLTPRARISIYFQGEANEYALQYRNKSILMQQTQNDIAHTEFYVSLFQFDKIKVFKKGKEIGSISFYAKNVDTKKVRQTALIDYSCSRRSIEVIGMENEFISLGCRMNRIGKWGKEKAMLEVLWTSANYRLLDGSHAPYIAVFLTNNPVKVKVINHNNEVKEIEIRAKVPKRLHRLNIAYGYGPYFFETAYDQDPNENVEDLLKYTEPIVPAFMAYFNYKIDNESSIRGFDAIVGKDSLFNNLGIYYASDIAKPLDKKLTITTLLGMQHLYFKFDDGFPTKSEPIFPQGIEFNYRHAFGIENYLINGGAFLSPSESIDYQNIWVRWGKTIFWELNYIYWGTGEFSAKMWGLSAGFFFGGFL